MRTGHAAVQKKGTPAAMAQGHGTKTLRQFNAADRSGGGLGVTLRRSKGDVVHLIGNPRLKMSGERWFDQRYILKHRCSDEGMEDMRLEEVM